jgi:hypothetical protein
MKHSMIPLRIVALLLLCGAVASGQGKYTLAYRFQPGTVYLYADTSVSKQTQEMGGQEMKISSNSAMRTRLVGEKVNADGAMSIIASFDSLKLALKMPGRDTTMVISDLLGKRTRLTVSPAGATISREIIDSAKVKGIMGSAVSMREVVRFHKFSKDPVEIGSTWKGEVVDSADMMGGKMISRAKMDYALQALAVCDGRSCVQIGFKGEIAIEGKGSMMGMDLFMEGKGKMSGVLMFDPAQGVVVQENSVTDTDMTAAVTGQQNMTIPSTANVKLSRHLISTEGGAK